MLDSSSYADQSTPGRNTRLATGCAKEARRLAVGALGRYTVAMQTRGLDSHIIFGITASRRSVCLQTHVAKAGVSIGPMSLLTLALLL